MAKPQGVAGKLPINWSAQQPQDLRGGFLKHGLDIVVEEFWGMRKGSLEIKESVPSKEVLRVHHRT
jgi:hypothetical protein